MPPSPTPPWTHGDPLPSPTVSVVIPALNEENNLPLVLEGLPPVDEVVVVDGGSVDDTVAVVREVRPDAVVIRQTRTGKGNALACGFAACTGDIVVTLNADGSTDPGELPRYVDALRAGAEVAHGSRYRDGGGNLAEGRWDRVGHRVLNWLVNVLFGTRFTDLGYGYNAYWRVLLPALDLPAPHLPGRPRGDRAWGDGPEIEPLINIRMAAQGLRVVEIASVGYPRIHGHRQRRVGAEVLRAVRALSGEYLRRWRIVHEASRTAGLHSARHGGADSARHGGSDSARHGGSAPGRRTSRQYAALRQVSTGAAAPPGVSGPGTPAPRRAVGSPAATGPTNGRHSAADMPDHGLSPVHGRPAEHRPAEHRPAERRQGARPQRAIERGRHAGPSADWSPDPSADWSPDTSADWTTDRRTGWSAFVDPPAGPTPTGRPGDRPDLTVISGEGGTGPAGRRDRMRPAHLRAVSGERYRPIDES